MGFAFSTEVTYHHSLGLAAKNEVKGLVPAAAAALADSFLTALPPPFDADEVLSAAFSSACCRNKSFRS